MSDLVFQSASQLAKAIRERSVCAVEVLEAHLTQIARHNKVQATNGKVLRIFGNVYSFHVEHYDNGNV